MLRTPKNTTERERLIHRNDVEKNGEDTSPLSD
jgi:hypothetical protein